MADELRKLVSLLRRKATIEAKKIKNDSSHWEGMCKGLYLGYEESASRLDKILHKYSSTESAQAAKYRAWDHVRELFLEEEKHRHSNKGQFHGHSHSVPGIWDSDNGPLAGKECAACAARRAALAGLEG